MKKYNTLIIGGGPAGVACAIAARNTYRDKSLAVIRKEKIALIPCGIPYVLNSLNSVDEDVLPDGLITNGGGELIIGNVVDRKENSVVLEDGQQIGFDKLVLAIGSTPIKPNIDGVDKENVFVVKKNYDNLQVVKQTVHDSENIVIIGGGYIGVEFADEALKAGKNVTIVELLDHLLAVSMDVEFGENVTENLRSRGGQIVLGKSVDCICGDGKVTHVKLNDGTKIKADMVIVSVGSKPNTELAKKFGLKVDEKWGIKASEFLQTSDKNVFAIGDCVAKYCYFSGEPTGVRLASTAMSEGRMVGTNLYEIKIIRNYINVLGSFATKVGDTAYGVSGITENRAKEMNLEYTVGVAQTVDRHPGKLAGASKVYMKLIFSRYSHTIVGAQIMGGDSVGEMVNMFAVMILNKMTDMDIKSLQIGTHPLLTASPVVYPAITATVDAIKKWF